MPYRSLSLLFLGVPQNFGKKSRSPRRSPHQQKIRFEHRMPRGKASPKVPGWRARGQRDTLEASGFSDGNSDGASSEPGHSAIVTFFGMVSSRDPF